MEPIEVAVIVGKMKGGGVEATIMSYVKSIDRVKVHFTLLVDHDSTLVPEDAIRRAGSDLIYIPPYHHQLAYQKFLIALFRQRRFDAVHAHISTMSVFPLSAAMRAGIPVRIVHYHSTAGRGEWAKNMMKYTLRPFSKIFATQLCACGQYAGEWAYGRRAHFTVMPNSIDFKAKNYCYDPILREKKRKEMRIGDSVLFGNVGRFIPQKNHSFLLAIFSMIHKVDPTAKLLLIGSGDLEDSVKMKVGELGLSDTVIFAGQRFDVPAFYQAMDILLIPSLYEGKPLVPIEAQISGLPVLASDRITKEIVVRKELVRFLSLREKPEKWRDTAFTLLKNAPLREKGFSAWPKKAAANELVPDQLSDWYCGLSRQKNARIK